MLAVELLGAKRSQMGRIRSPPSVVRWGAAFLLFVLCLSIPAHAFDMVNSGAQGLSPECAKVVGELQAGMKAGDPQASTTVLEALYATGRVVEAPPPTPEQQKQAVLSIVTGYPWTSLGSPDSCKYITTKKGAAADFQYCHIDVAGAYLRYGICVPEACTADDIAIGLNASFTKITKQPLDPSIHLAPMTTCGDPRIPYVTGTYVMIAVTIFLLALVALGTTVEYLRITTAAPRQGARGDPEMSSPGVMVDVDAAGRGQWFQRDTTVLRLLLCFSAIKNWKLLFAKARGGPFDSLDGIRTLSMGWVVFGHVFIFALFGVDFTNAHQLLGINGEGWLTRYSAQALTGGYFAVDTFFFLSAFLAVYLMMEQVHRMQASKGTALPFLFSSPYIYLMRFIRLTPTYCYILLMNWFVLRLAGSGPFWKQSLSTDINMCQKGWWTNLLYINNLVTFEQNGQAGAGCFSVSWYLAVDFQLFLLTPLVAVAAIWNHVATLILLTSASIIAMVCAVVYSYKNEWSIDFLDQSTYFHDYYIAPWMRSPPYLIGMILAIVWFHHYRGTTSGVLPSLVGRVRRDRLWVYSLFAVSFLLMGITVYGAEGAYRNNPPDWSRSMMSAYIGLSKPAWTIGLAIFVYLLFLGEGGLLKDFLECRLFTILSRLTFCAYLIHPMVIAWTYGELIGPIHYTDEWYALTYVGVLSSVVILSIAVHLVVERPVANLERLLRPPSSSKASKDFAKAEVLNSSSTTTTTANHTNGGGSDDDDAVDLDSSELGKPLLADHRKGGGADQ